MLQKMARMAYTSVQSDKGFFCLFTEEMDNTEYMNNKCPGETVWKYTMIRAQLFKANDIVS